MNSIMEIEYVLKTTFNVLPPLLLAGLGGMITSRIGILNLGLEGMMLIGAFVAVVTNYYTGSALLGLVCAIVVASLMGGVFALLNLRFKVDNIIVSVGINLFAVAVTRYLLTILFHVSGAFTSDKIVKMATVKLGFLEQIPILRMLSNLSVAFWLAILITVVLSFIINKTPLGLHIRATGLNDTAVDTAGISAAKIRYGCIILSGTLCGIAGAYLSTSYLAMFTVGMTNGRGYLGNIASIMGARSAVGTLLGALLFSFTEGVTMKIQTFGFPSQLIQMIPYLIAFAVVITLAVVQKKRKGTAQ